MQMWEISMQDTKKKLSDISPPAETLDNLPRRNTESSRMNAAQILKNTGLPPTKTPRQMFYDLYAQKIELKLQSEELQRMQVRL
jgi:PIN domain nuclease of toxin-antitoxin system